MSDDIRGISEEVHEIKDGVHGLKDGSAAIKADVKKLIQRKSLEAQKGILANKLLFSSRKLTWRTQCHFEGAKSVTLFLRLEKNGSIPPPHCLSREGRCFSQIQDILYSPITLSILYQFLRGASKPLCISKSATDS